MKNKVKYAKSLAIASIIASIGAIGWGVYELTNNEFFIGLGFIFGGIVISRLIGVICLGRKNEKEDCNICFV